MMSFQKLLIIKVYQGIYMHVGPPQDSSYLFYLLTTPNVMTFLDKLSSKHRIVTNSFEYLV